MSHLKTQVSTRNWRWRSLRLLVVATSSTGLIVGLKPETTWHEFPALLTPLVVFSLVGALAGAALTGVDSQPGAEPEVEKGEG